MTLAKLLDHFCSPAPAHWSADRLIRAVAASTLAQAPVAQLDSGRGPSDHDASFVNPLLKLFQPRARNRTENDAGVMLVANAEESRCLNSRQYAWNFPQMPI